MTQRKDQRTEKASPSFATKIYSNLQAKPKAPADGWAKQRKDWGEDDYHRRRGATSPLGGQAKK